LLVYTCTHGTRVQKKRLRFHWEEGGWGTEDFSRIAKPRADGAAQRARVEGGGTRGRVGLIKINRADNGQLIICHDDFQVRPGFFVLVPAAF